LFGGRIHEMTFGQQYFKR